MLFGAAAFAIPGGRTGVGSWSFGNVGRGRSRMRSGVEELTEVGVGLCSIGIPKNIVRNYESALNADDFIVFIVEAHGTTAEVTKASEVMPTTRPTELERRAIERGEHSGASA
jgi:hypothetical protein